MNVLPNTPNKRYSLESNECFATPAADDSETSLYYSFNLSEDDCLTNKENSINGGPWKGTTPKQVPNDHTSSLLRNVLQSNLTPQNKNNKRISFSYLSKPSPIASQLAVEIPEALVAVTITSSVNNNGMEAIDENPTPGNTDTISDTASDTTDDLENEMHNTIIENPYSVTNNGRNRAGPSESKTAASSEFKSTGITKPVDEIFSETNTKFPSNTVNATKIIRQRLADESRKNSLPVAKRVTRFTTHTRRRSSTFEPRKVDPRKSLGVLKKVEKKVSKSIAGKVKECMSIAKISHFSFPQQYK